MPPLAMQVVLVITGWLFFAFGCVRLIVAFVNYISSLNIDTTSVDGHKKNVSVLIPARNEEQNLLRLLESFQDWREEVLELIIYDDLSTDRTYEIALNQSRQDPKIKIIRGETLPRGWLGKNHACHNLSKAASGDILLFIDADIFMCEGSVSVAVSYLDKYGLEMLSVFPTQVMDNWGSRLSVPLMNWILLSLLPLPAVRLAPYPSLAAANGQFMMFRTERYKLIEPHKLFRWDAVEDIAIIKYYKRNKLNAATLLGGSAVYCRMYSGLRESIAGFSKNIMQFFGGNPVVCWLFVKFTTIAPFWIFIFNGFTAGVIYAAVIILLRVLISVASCQSVFFNLLLMIPQQVVLWIIALEATSKNKTKNRSWKGRQIS